MANKFFYLFIAFLIALFLELYVETKLKIRQNVMKRLGRFPTIIILFFLIISIHYIAAAIDQKIVEHPLFIYIIVVLIGYFIPKKGDQL